MESWKMNQLLSPVVNEPTQDAYIVSFDYEGMKIAHRGELVFIESIPPEVRQQLTDALAQRKDTVEDTILRLTNWKDGLENRVQDLEDNIDEADMGDEFSYYADTFYESRETMMDDWETERDEAQEKVDELEDQLKMLGRYDQYLQYAMYLIGNVGK